MSDETEIADSEEKLTIRAKIAALRSLVANEGWQNVLLPHLKMLHEEHLSAAISPGLTPEGRAEHIQAVHTLNSLLTWPEDQIADLRKKDRHLNQSKPPTS